MENNPDKNLKSMKDALASLDRVMAILLELVTKPLPTDQQNMLSQLGVSLAYTITRATALEDALKKEIARLDNPNQSNSSNQMNNTFGRMRKDAPVAPAGPVSWWDAKTGKFADKNVLGTQVGKGMDGLTNVLGITEQPPASPKQSLLDMSKNAIDKLFEDGQAGDKQPQIPNPFDGLNMNSPKENPPEAPSV